MDEDYEEEGACQQEVQEQQMHQDDSKKVMEKYIQELYNQFDLDGNGTLSFKELRKALHVLGLLPTVKDVKDTLKKYKLEKRKIGFEEFKEIMHEQLASKTDSKVELTLAFSVFDKNNDGYIDKHELRRYLRKMGEEMTDDELDWVFSSLDKDNNGKLSIVEMVEILAI